MLKMDLSGLDAIITMCDNAKAELPKMDADFMKYEWHEFVKTAQEIIEKEAYDTGYMQGAFRLTDLNQLNGITEADWNNIAEYATFNNYGFTHYISGKKIPGVFWWERAFSALENESAKRYAEMLKNLMEMR
ncbi:MAG: hypothetical protein FWB96_11490 [Defluviitaleaceae bacterium]|nr:hypothetical protein [Defluviitaleaceae bacterium]MCL2263686.1 hypothetical protein [Defluviitaleaceae bacterium]